MTLMMTPASPRGHAQSLSQVVLDTLRSGRGPAPITLRGMALLADPVLNKDAAFTDAERDALGLRGLLPPRVIDIDAQVSLELEHVRRKEDDLERYIGLAALHDRNETLFHRVLLDHLEELLPIVYTPTVGRACQEFSHQYRQPRGVWITPDDVGRVPEILRHAAHDEIRLIVVTDNERILGLGDQGAGGMPIPVGKLALYSAAAGIHPGLTLPVSLDVGTDRQALLADPLYAGWRHPRLRGAAYDEVVEAFVAGVREVHPRAVLQWEDFKQHNAIRLLARYRQWVCSFNDDIQGTSAIAVATMLAALRASGRTLADARIVLAGAGAAGTGIARLLRLAMVEDGMDAAAAHASIAVLDSHGLVVEGRPDLDDDKWEAALPRDVVAGLGLDPDVRHDLHEVVVAFRPDILLGTTGIGGAFDEATIRAMAACSRAPDHPAALEPDREHRGAARGRDGLDRRPGDRGDGQPVPAGGDRWRLAPGPAGEQRLRVPGHRPGGDRVRGADPARFGVPGGGATTRRHDHAPRCWRRAACSRRSGTCVSWRARSRSRWSGTSASWASGGGSRRRRSRPRSRRRCGARTTSRTRPCSGPGAAGAPGQHRGILR